MELHTQLQQSFQDYNYQIVNQIAELKNFASSIGTKFRFDENENEIGFYIPIYELNKHIPTIVKKKLTTIEETIEKSSE